uniref:Uncharacterized protein n=1 Tax=Rhizophora mucronata TaxID=61149 RepID=A0A2P2QAH9_RHIMU
MIIAKKERKRCLISTGGALAYVVDSCLV